jgi:putative nucleotidyltransferase with HDIG domain
MGEFKQLLRVGDRSAVESVVRLFLNAGCEDVSVVVGHRAQELVPVIESAGARCVMNHQFEQGMYSSVRAGVQALPSNTEACFVIPADIPLIRVSTIRRLARFYPGKGKSIVYPVFEGRRGHPPLISRAVLDEVLQTGPEARLSTVLAAHEDAARNLFVPDEGICLDMDTPDDFARVRELAADRDLPNSRECEAMLAVYQTENQVARHSRVVADVAHRLASALAGKGVMVNPRLAQAGGLLHDIAKGQEHHAEAGASLLKYLEFVAIASVVASHTDCAFENGKLDEAAIVYLADKLVSGERVVGLAQRFHRSLERFRDNPVALASALRRRSTAEAIAQAIENCLGAELQHIIGQVWSRTGSHLD